MRFSQSGTSVTRVAAALLVGALVPATASLADTYPRQDGVDVLEYVFRLELSDTADNIAGLTTVDVRFTDTVTQVALDLVGVASEPHGMTVDSVVVAQASQRSAAMAPTAGAPGVGSVANYQHVDNRLVVDLPQPASRNDRAFITIAYRGQPETGLIIGDNKHGTRSFFSDNWPNKARHWLPTLDHPGDKARSQMVVTASDEYQVISNGLLVEETDLGGGRRLTHWKQSVPIASWIYVLGATRFAVQHLGTHVGVPVQTWVYAEDRDAGFYDFAYPTVEALRFYSEHVGPYAYEKLANVQSNSVGGGMEAASAIFYGDNSVTGDRSVRWRNVIVHEIAHQWFGNAVTESDWDDVWLSEGFATYFTSLFIEHEYGRDEFVEVMQRARDSVRTFYADNPDYRIVHDNLDDMRRVTTGMQYQKGSWVLHMLRRQIGTETFWRGIREYYADYFNGNATTADFRRAMEEVSGQDLEWFFAQWLYRGGLPEIEIGHTYDAAAGDVVVTLRQVQAGQPLLLPVTVEIRTASGSSRISTMLEDEARVRVTLDGEPTEVVLDPDTDLLMREVGGAQ